MPLFVKDEFGELLQGDVQPQQVSKEDMRAVFLEYAWDMSWCDPCAADPLSPTSSGELGVFWLGARSPGAACPARQNVFLTRLHLRYDAAHFPEDLVFQETADRQNFQGRYVLRHPWTGNATCAEAKAYRRDLPKKMDAQAVNLARLTGWDVNKIRGRMNLKTGGPGPDTDSGSSSDSEPWWKKIWKN